MHYYIIKKIIFSINKLFVYKNISLEGKKEKININFLVGSAKKMEISKPFKEYKVNIFLDTLMYI